MPKPIFMLVLFLGGFFAAAGLALLLRSLWFVRRATETEGRVIRYEVRKTPEYSGGVRFAGSYPVIAFEDLGGKTREFVSTVPAIEGTPKRLPVLYWRDEPTRAEQKHFRSQWFSALMFFGLALIFAGGGFLVKTLLR